MAHKKVVPGDKLKIPAATWNGIVDLLLKKVPKLQSKVTDTVPVGCLRAFITSSDPSILPLTPVTWGGVSPLSFRGLDYMVTNDPLVEISTTLSIRAPLGITQTVIKSGMHVGYVRTHGVSWVKVSEDTYDDVTDYGCTYLNVYPGIGLRGAFAGPMRVISVAQSPYLQVSLQDYYPSTILAAASVLGIPAKSGFLPGSASCELLYQHPRTEEIVASGASLDIYNNAEAAVESGAEIQAKIEGFSGRYFVDWEECPTSVS